MSTSKVKEYLLLIIVAATLWSVSITSIATGLLAAVWLFEGDLKNKFKSLLNQRLLLLLIAFYLLHIIGLIYSANVQEGISDLGKMLSMIAFPLVMAGGWNNQEEIKNKALWMLTISTIGAGLVCFTYAIYRNIFIGDPEALDYSFYENFDVEGPISGIYWDYFSYAELSRPLRLHPTYFSLYVALVILFLCYALFKQSRFIAKHRVATYIAIAFLITFLLLLSSRIVIVGFIACLITGVIILVVKETYNKKAVLGGSLLIAIVIVTLFALPITRYRLVDEVTAFEYEMPAKEEAEATGVTMRMIHWNAALDVIKENPIFGVGTGYSQIALDKKYKAYGYTNLLGYNAHNQYLQTTVTLGIIGLLVLLYFLLAAFISTVRSGSYLAALFFTLFAIACIGEVLLLSNKGIIFFSLFASLFLQKQSVKSL